VRFHNATPDVTLEGRFYAGGPQITSRRAWEEAKTYAEWARKPITTGPYRVEEYKPDVSLTLVAHDEHWAGRPPLERIRFVEVPEVAGRVNGLLSGEYDFACDLPPDQIGTVANAPGLEVQSSTIWNHRIMVFNNAERDRGESARAPGHDPCDRPTGHRRRALGGTDGGAQGPAVRELCGRQHAHRGLGGAGITIRNWPAIC
jgi:hypothetical protein